MDTVRMGTSLKNWAANTRESILFHVKRPDWNSAISTELPFGDVAAQRFRHDLSACATYLEYGSGSSTLAATGAGCRVVSVESDPRFLAAVENRSRSRGLNADRADWTFLHADIGRTGPWGVPIVKYRSQARAQAWSGYPLAPWIALGRDFRADLVLVDGRFRVACALAQVVYQSDTDWSLLVDDYVDRPEYWVIEGFAQVVEIRGRMASFTRKPDVDPAAAVRMLHDYFSDWR